MRPNIPWVGVDVIINLSSIAVNWCMYQEIHTVGYRLWVGFYYEWVDLTILLPDNVSLMISILNCAWHPVTKILPADH